MTARNGTKMSGRTTPKKNFAQIKPIEMELPPPVPVAPDGKLRLLKVVIQPVFVLVRADGEVQEVQHPAVEIKGVDWNTWSTEAFTEDALEQLRLGIAPLTSNGQEGGSL